MKIRHLGWRSVLVASITALVTAGWTSAPAPAATRRPSTPTAKKPFALALSLEEYQTNLAKFHKDFDNPENWKDENGVSEDNYAQNIPVTIVGGFNCALNSPIRVTPARNIKFLQHRQKSEPVSKPSDLDSGKGFLIAKITNDTNCETVPLTVGHGTYYWVVRRNPQGAGEPQSLIISQVDARVVQTVSLFRCNTAETAHKNDGVAVFKKGDVCNSKITHRVSDDPTSYPAYYSGLRAETLTGRTKKQPMGFKLIGPDDFALWFTCNMGCCYADGFGT